MAGLYARLRRLALFERRLWRRNAWGGFGGGRRAGGAPV